MFQSDGKKTEKQKQYLSLYFENCKCMTEEKKDIIIANPMYDVVFKSLMADRENARYFMSAILGEKIIDIDFAPQEYIQEKQVQTESQIETLKIIRLDFVATIRTRGGGKKKVLIEIQQSFRPADIVRFRTYLGEQYINEANIVRKGDKIEQALPIVVIYMIGDETPKTSHIKDVAYKVNRSGISLLDGSEIEIHNPTDLLIEALTHDAYFIHVSRIHKEMYADWKKCSELMKVLSLFEQSNFVNENFYKSYPYPKTNKNINKMLNTLEYLVADPMTKRAMEEQRFAEMDVLSWKQTYAEQKRAIAKKDKTIAAQAKELEELKRRFGLS